MPLRHPLRSSILSAAAVTLAIASTGHAQVVRTWDGEDSTDFFDVDTNWSGNVAPGPLDTARFTTPFTGTYSVLWDNFTGEKTTAAVEVLAGNLTFKRQSGNPRTYTVTTATIDAARLQLNDITLALNGTATVSNGGTFDINAAGKLAGGGSSSLVLASGGHVNLTDGKLVANSITAPSGFNFTGGTLVASNYTGALTQSGGTLSPGDVGTRVGMIIAQGYTMTGGTFAADLTASNSDQLIVGGQISLAGNLSLNNVASPLTLGTSRILVDGVGVTGHFATVSGVSLSDNRSAAVTYTGSQALVTVAIPGDASLNNVVGFEDLVPLAMRYHQTGTIWAQGDFDGDGVTEFSDLVILAQHYNQNQISLGLPAGLSADFAADWAIAQSLVPEPTALVASSALFIAISARRRRA